MPVGRIAPIGISLIVVGMFGLTQIDENTSYALIIAMLVVMGLGMGSTMMPLFTSALKTLTAHQVARGSTLLNISQQISSSVGVATMSVVLTSHLNNSPIVPGTEKVPGLDGGITETGAAILSNTRPAVFAQLGIDPSYVARGLTDAASSFAHTYWVAWSLVALTLVPALLLPRRREEAHLLDDEGKPPVVVQ